MRTKLITFITLAVVLSVTQLSGAQSRARDYRHVPGQTYIAGQPEIMEFISDNSFFFFGNETLKAHSDRGEISVRIVDINGRVVLEHYSMGMETTISLGSLKSGIYFAVMNNDPRAVCKINILR